MVTYLSYLYKFRIELNDHAIAGGVAQYVAVKAEMCKVYQP